MIFARKNSTALGAVIKILLHWLTFHIIAPLEQLLRILTCIIGFYKRLTLQNNDNFKIVDLSSSLRIQYGHNISTKTHVGIGITKTECMEMKVS